MFAAAGLLVSLALPHLLPGGKPGGLIQDQDKDKVKIIRPLSFPALPPGVNPAFSEQFYAIEDKILAHDYEGAKALLKRMPSRHVTYAWADRNISREDRFEFDSRRIAAVNLIRKGINLDIQLADNPNQADVKFSFEKQLSEEPGTHQLRAVATFYHSEAGQVPFEIVIGLERSGHQHASPNDIFNDVAYGLATYFGSAHIPLPGAATDRTDAPAQKTVTGNTNEGTVIGDNLDALDALRHMLEPSLIIEGGKPNLFLDPPALKTDKVQTQGEPIHFEILLTNRGSGLLTTKLIPDCSCFSTDNAFKLNGGDSGIYHVKMDTSQYGGHFHKTLYLLSNDPDRPVIKVPVDVDIAPRYRFLTPEGSTFVVEDEHSTHHVILLVEGEPLQPTSVRIEGVPGEVDYQPWKGVIADPGQNRSAVSRSGYMLNLAIGENMTPGRHPFTLVVDTNDPAFPSLKASFSAQRGIAASPPDLYLGQLGFPTTAKVSFDRPHKPFRILKIRSSSPHFRALSFSKKAAASHLITVKYDGLGESGDVSAYLDVVTDDPKQKKLRISITGRVR